MNWGRPTKLVKVKKYIFKIHIDKCCVKLVRLIDNLDNTYTTWCCCGHGLIPMGVIEFNSSLKLSRLKEMLSHNVYRDNWRNKNKIKGYHIRHKCYCNKKITEKARKHF